MIPITLLFFILLITIVVLLILNVVLPFFNQKYPMFWMLRKKSFLADKNALEQNCKQKTKCTHENVDQ